MANTLALLLYSRSGRIVTLPLLQALPPADLRRKRSIYNFSTL
jgi:hypothetical protein